MNKAKLRAIMIEHGDTYDSLSALIGCSKSTFSQKMNEKVPSGFTQQEIRLIRAKYDLTDEQVIEIFFGD